MDRDELDFHRRREAVDLAIRYRAQPTVGPGRTTEDLVASAKEIYAFLNDD